MSLSKLFEKPALFLGALYTLAWGPMLLMRGAYWDGWVFFSEFIYKDFAWVYSVFDQNRNYHHYYTFRFLELFPDPAFVGRSIVFLSWLISGLLLLHILRRFFKWNTYAATLVVAYFLIYPVFIVRFEFIHFYYSASMLFFSVGCYLYLDQVARTRLWTFVREAVALPLIVLAFFTNSFVFFFFGFLGAHFILFSQQKALSLRLTIQKWLARYWYLLALPFAFMAFKSIFLDPFGIYAHYNRILLLHPSAAVMSKMIEGAWGGLWAGFLWPFVNTLQLLERKYFAATLILTTAIVIFLFRKSRISAEPMLTLHLPGNQPFYVRFYRNNPELSVVIIGAAFLFLGLFPYVAVGKYPHIYGHGFGLRHSLLMPLGSAFVLFGVIVYFVRERLQIFAHMALLSLSLAFLWFNFFLLDVDWYKQQAIMAELPAIVVEIPPPATIVFSDTLPGYNWLNRNVSWHDYLGYLETVTGTREYHGISTETYHGSGLPEDNQGQRIESVRIVSNRGWDSPIVPEWIYLKWIEIRYGQGRLQSEASRILQISLVHEGSITQ